MKYWTSSRVGAVPQPTPSSSSKKKDGHNHNNSSSSSSRFQRKKGITMEDLKKQTALRLAHEQKQQNKQSGGASRGSSNNGGAALSGDAANHVHTNRSVVSGPAMPNGGVVPVSDAAMAQQVGTNPAAFMGGRENYQPSHQSLDPSLEQQQLYQPSSSFASDPSMTPLTAVPPYLPCESHRPSSSLDHPYHLSLVTSSSTSGFQVESTQNISTHSSSSFDSSTQQQQQPPPSNRQQQQQRKKSKLPHGLTVQELKEMTKARLQAEAAEKNGLVNGVVVGGGGGGAPSGFRDDGVSPLPPVFAQQQRSRPAPHNSQSRDAWSYDSRSEAWETGSVSTVASEYLGSESAYGIGGGLNSFGPEEPSPSPYGRPPLGGGGPVHNFSDAPPLDGVMFPGASASSAGHQFGDASGPLQLRRRAATLSPRQGLGFLDERREVYPEHETVPALPSFSSPSSLHYTSRSRNCVYGSAVGLRMMTSPTTNMEFNRPRTSSATSLPPISHTADEFSTKPSTFRRIPSGITPFRDDAPSPSVTGLADAFQEPNFQSSILPPPPGLGGTELRPRAPTVTGLVGLNASEFHGNNLSLDSYDDAPGGSDLLRTRASTWGGTTSLDSVFGPGLFGGSLLELTNQREQQHPQSSSLLQQEQRDSTLCDDLASILNLSAVPEQQQQQHYHASRGDNQLFPPPGL